MPDDLRPRGIAGMPAQRPGIPRSAAEARGRFSNTGNAFNIVNTPVPDHAFEDEPRRALDEGTPTGKFACDLSALPGCPFPATSPFVLARYGRIRAGESLTTDFVASGTIAHVIQGTGITVHTISNQKSSTSPLRSSANFVTTRVPIANFSAASRGLVRSTPLK
jgi:hypothetical protein